MHAAAGKKYCARVRASASACKWNCVLNLKHMLAARTQTYAYLRPRAWLPGCRVLTAAVGWHEQPFTAHRHENSSLHPFLSLYLYPSLPASRTNYLPLSITPSTSPPPLLSLPPTPSHPPTIRKAGQGAPRRWDGPRASGPTRTLCDAHARVSAASPPCTDGLVCQLLRLRSYNNGQSQLPEKRPVRAVPATRPGAGQQPIAWHHYTPPYYERLLLCLLRHCPLRAGSELTKHSRTSWIRLCSEFLPSFCCST